MIPKQKILENKENWIYEETELTPTNNTLKILHNFNDINEFAFRILGNDYASFGYSVVPKEFWHNSGAYEMILDAYNSGGDRCGYAMLKVSNKTNNSFDIIMEQSDCTNVNVAYKLK